MNRLNLLLLSALPMLAVLALAVHAPVVAQSAQPKMTDSDISGAVDRELIDDPGVPGQAIDVKVSNGVVTLTGTATNLLAKERATRVAEAVRGVRSVVNSIKLDLPNRTDSRLETDVVSSLGHDRATDAIELTVDVANQMVTLSGTVESWQEKELAERIAKGVTGVRGVTNNITISYPMTRPDSEIHADVEKALLWNTLVDDSMTTVSVDQRIVHLSGIVGSAAEKRLATSEAWVNGVTAVKNADLEVKRWARDEDLRKSKYVDRTDDQVKQAVHDALVQDPRVFSFNVNVAASNGIITLTGNVDNLKAKRSAAGTAGNTVGVWRVKNRIKVRGNAPKDATVEKNLNAALERNPYVEPYEVTATVLNGVATLTGVVDSYFEKGEADEVAAATFGITKVNNNLVVSDLYHPYGYDPYIDEYPTRTYDWYDNSVLRNGLSDWEIRQDVKDELWWSPFVDSDDITVTVDNGVATLTGTVQTFDEYQTAAENALEGGAVSVDNDLIISYGPEMD